jgi:hyperosmotically inducible protein
MFLPAAAHGTAHAQLPFQSSIKAAEDGGANAMRRVLLILATIALLLPPTVLLAQSPTPEVKKTAKADEAAKSSGTGNVMKDSWITTKTKLALTTDGRTKARHIAVETQAATVMLRGKVSSAEERVAAEQIARSISGVAYVSNALQIVPDDQRKAIDVKDDGIETAIRERLLKDSQLKDYAIKVRSDNSVVTLQGKVSDPKVKSRASDVVRGVPGVRAVRNELGLKG